MKTLKLTELGGFPLTQDALNWMQLAYTEALNGIVSIAPDPYVILSGCQVTGSGPYNIAAGVVVAGGVIMPFAGAAVTDINTVKFKVLDLTTTLIYEDGTSKPVKKEKQLVVDPTGTIFYSELKPFLLSAASRFSNNAWITATPLVPNVDIKFKVDNMNKVCHVRGTSPYQNDYWDETTAICSGLPLPDGLTFANIVVSNTENNAAKDADGHRFRESACRLLNDAGGANLVVFSRPLHPDFSNGTDYELADWSLVFNFSYSIQ